MDFTIILTTLTIIGTVLSVVGIAYKSVVARVGRLEVKIADYPTKNEVRLVISDKLAPIDVSYAALEFRLDELARFHHELDKKVDKILELCAKLPKK